MHTELSKIPALWQEDRIKSIVLVYAILIFLLVIAELIAPGFMALNHMESVLRQAAFLGIVAIGQTFVILTGGIDLSIASVISLTNVVAAQVMDGKDANVAAAVLLVLLIGVAAGLANGLGVFYLRIPSLVMTLGIGSVLQGISLIYSKGAPKGHTAPLIEFISTGKIAGTISGILVLWLILSVITIVILKYTVFGRNIFALGTNVVAARYSGVSVSKVTILVYIISGVTAALTGLLLVGYTGTSYLNAGETYSMNSIASVVIGGTSITGGFGGYAGTIAGSIIMTIIGGLLTIIKIPISGRYITQGLIIILLVLVYGRQKSKM